MNLEIMMRTLNTLCITIKKNNVNDQYNVNNIAEGKNLPIIDGHKFFSIEERL